MQASRKPKYRRQRRKGKPDLAFVELGGRRFYLGNYGTDESRAEYRRLLVEWMASGARTGLRDASCGPHVETMAELLAAFWQHAQTHYRRPDGTTTSELRNFRGVVRTLGGLYGHRPPNEFGPKALKAVRAHLIERGLARKTINGMVRRIRSVFKWAVGEELVDPSVYHGLQAVTGLTRGRSKARETKPVRPVSDEHVEAIRPFVSRPVWAMVELQRLSGARSGEVVVLRGKDIDRTGDVWFSRPDEHKTAHHEIQRMLFFGPRAQRVLLPFLESRGPEEPLFSPKDAEKERRDARTATRKTPLSCGNSPGTNRKRRPTWRPGDRYTADTYGRAIARACKKAGVPHWHPHQLRHSVGTMVRERFGLEVSRVILGHRSVSTTELYAEADIKKAVDVIQRIG